MKRSLNQSAEAPATICAASAPAAPQLPMSRREMDELGWDTCDIIIVTGDAYVDHPSFGMAVIGRVLEAHGFRVGIISQPDWHSADAFRALGRPRLFYGVTAGNMDSMVNRYTSERRIRSEDAYSPDGAAGLRPDRAVTVYAQRCREAFKGVPVIIGSIEASLRRIAHYDYWSDTVRRSVLPDSKAEMLVYGNAERQIVEIAKRLDAGESVTEMGFMRGTAVMRREVPAGWTEIASTEVDTPGELITHADPYAMQEEKQSATCSTGASAPADAPTQAQPIRIFLRRLDAAHTVIRMPSFEQVKDDPVLYAHASRLMHLETNPGNARALVQRHGERDVWLNPPPIPLTTPEMDWVFGLPYSRRPHDSYGRSKIPAYEMIKTSVNIMRGCFGGCTFCSITEHEGRIIQSRSEDSIVREIEAIRDKTPGFAGVISDLGGPTANMYRLACKSREIEAACRLPSCVFPDICKNLNTDHAPLIHLYRRARALPGIKKVFIASGLRYDLAVRSPEYVEELATHHVGGYLKIAPEHTEDGPLGKMMKPGVGSFEAFRKLFDHFSAKAGKKQYLIPYFIAAHPGTTDEDMLNLALWLKHNHFKPDQVQAFLPSPMATASAMYHSGRNPLRRIGRNSELVFTPKRKKQRELHKAFLRYHDPANWPLLREALKKMGRSELIGSGNQCLVPAGAEQSNIVGRFESRQRKNGGNWKRRKKK
ncbi:MAG: YgiQ family radical SAM protein [Zetaproteobacteria bacterium CG12_big_fil_rev_8_21_14_0_65_55_1124]|nr:MAG: YgiQ family radical SAM protein [Zetaproteobacteria bacterium CG08_land_8_20_14_0_20_55_17]PIW42668.1 MAG: YgiQ family radical SAM protein [Zetaproteobacteria bacterium CG12_big_fil_rev_8_21_14_0_65_55_1124]PIY52035.1 MAG: YgiQ family radical SAM protein [Zetaproteobacteria bacterium CG_4_10_14_0_8_um_filter_55_43]PIZ38959.1 MAG: YgiQ family radical SAM protein [Zetaproteobacteria bacterium CG_4_10_14_0_2_um_filter_55_20]PJB79992.1 MAG: YgiQ family radical SAM protein [Zetaproteobacteri